MKAMVVLALLLIASSAAAGPARNAPAVTAEPKPFIVHRQLEAMVSSLDESGLVLLRTAVGRLTLGATEAAKTILRKGDRVIVDVALLRHPDPNRLPREAPLPQPLLMRRVAAVVTAVQRTLGTVSLRTAAGSLSVDLPYEALSDLHTGDRLLVELGVRQDPGVSALPRMPEQQRRAGFGALIFGLFGAAKGESQSR